MGGKNHEDNVFSEYEHQAQQSAMNKIQNNVSGSDKREDSDRSYIEMVRKQENELHVQRMNFNQDKHDQDMRERRHHDERIEQLRISPSEAKSQSEVLSGVQIEAIKSIVVEAVGNAIANK